MKLIVAITLLFVSSFSFGDYYNTDGLLHKTRVSAGGMIFYDESTYLAWLVASSDLTIPFSSGQLFTQELAGSRSLGSALTILNSGPLKSNDTQWRTPSISELKTLENINGISVPYLPVELNAGSNCLYFWSSEITGGGTANKEYSYNTYKFNGTVSSNDQSLGSASESCAIVVREFTANDLLYLYDVDSNTRFVDNFDGTITDSLNNIEWMKDAGDGYNDGKCFDGASDIIITANKGAYYLDLQAYINNINNGSIVCPNIPSNKLNWRLPTINELKSISNTVILGDIPLPFDSVQYILPSTSAGDLGPQDIHYYTSDDLVIVNGHSQYRVFSFVGGGTIFRMMADKFYSNTGYNPNRAWLVRDIQDDIIYTGDDAFPDNPLYSQDADADGLPDEWEINRIGNLNSSDTSDGDNDGFTTLQEFTAGTDPLVVTVQSGFSQADIDSAVAACADDPLSCGIDIDAAIQDAIESCVSEPVSCGISSGVGITSHSLIAGWNLIGGMDASDSTAIQSFMDDHNANSVWSWDGQWKSFIDGTPQFLNTLMSMSADKGYFVNVPAQ